MIGDELTGWLNSMTAYNDADREFWIEAYGGRPFRVERRRKNQPYLDAFRGSRWLCSEARNGKTCVSVQGRGRWVIFPLRVGVAGAPAVSPRERSANAQWAIDSLDRLRLLDLAHMPGSE